MPLLEVRTFSLKFIWLVGLSGHKQHPCSTPAYSLNKKEWICSLFKEWILEKSEIRVNLEWTFLLFTHFGVTSGIAPNPWVIPVVTPKLVHNTNVHSKFTLISLFSKIHSLKSEHIHSFCLESRSENLLCCCFCCCFLLLTTPVEKSFPGP